MLLTSNALFINQYGIARELANHYVKDVDGKLVCGNPLRLARKVLSRIERSLGESVTARSRRAGFNIRGQYDDRCFAVVRTTLTHSTDKTQALVPRDIRQVTLPDNDNYFDVLKGLDIGGQAIHWIKEFGCEDFKPVTFNFIVGETLEGIEGYFCNKQVTIPAQFNNHGETITITGLKFKDLIIQYPVQALDDMYMLVVGTIGHDGKQNINVILHRAVDDNPEHYYLFIRELASDVIGIHWEYLELDYNQFSLRIIELVHEYMWVFGAGPGFDSDPAELYSDILFYFNCFGMYVSHSELVKVIKSMEHDLKDMPYMGLLRKLTTIEIES